MTAPDPIIDFLKKDYELKINYLTAHLTRMWQRFNFFIAAIGVFSSILWYFFNAQDRYLVALYREQVKDIGERIAEELKLNFHLQSKYVCVGDQTRKLKMR